MTTDLGQVGQVGQVVEKRASESMEQFSDRVEMVNEINALRDHVQGIESTINALEADVGPIEPTEEQLKSYHAARDAKFIEQFTGEGRKDDDGKPRLDLVLGGFAAALYEVGEVGTKGAVKYDDDNWRYVVGGRERYLNAMLRHYLHHKMGSKDDPETGLSHLAHMAWNALAALSLIGE